MSTRIYTYVIDDGFYDMIAISYSTVLEPDAIVDSGGAQISCFGGNDSISISPTGENDDFTYFGVI